MDFEQAERIFAELEGRLQAGDLDLEAYREGLSELRVEDDLGRTWMLQERTGAWFVWTGEAWEPGDPPRATPEPTPPPPPPAPAPFVPGAPSPGALSAEPVAISAAPPPMPQPAPVIAAAAAVAPDRGKNIFGLVWRLVLWAAVWGAVGYGVLTQSDIETNGILVMVAVALVTLAIVLWQLTRVYEGVIERVRIEQETDTDEDGSTTTRNVTYAYIRTTDNKVKKVKAKRGFERGDLVYKRVGDWTPRKPKA